VGEFEWSRIRRTISDDSDKGACDDTEGGAEGGGNREPDGSIVVDGIE
jgi:hypothetical protein